MAGEAQSTTAAHTSQGQALQKTKKAYSEMAEEINGVEKMLKVAETPPPPVYQPLLDCRKTDFDALAVLFYKRRHLTGSMDILQFCCDAQLAVCPWPFKCSGLWDVEKPLSAANIDCSTWNEYFRSKTKTCWYLPHEVAVAAVDTRSHVIMFADFQEPSASDDKVSSPPHARSYPSSTYEISQSCVFSRLITHKKLMRFGSYVVMHA
jgi:hypothetical protein